MAKDGILVHNIAQSMEDCLLALKKSNRKITGPSGLLHLFYGKQISNSYMNYRFVGNRKMERPVCGRLQSVGRSVNGGN